MLHVTQWVGWGNPNPNPNPNQETHTAPQVGLPSFVRSFGFDKR